MTLSASPTVRIIKRGKVEKAAAEPMRYTLGIVYEPDVVDAHDDFATAPEIEKACHNYMRLLTAQGNAVVKAAGDILEALIKAEPGDEIEIDLPADDVEKRGVGVQHLVRGDDLGDVVENYIAPVDFDLPQDDGTVEHVAKGTWLQGIVWCAPVWKMVESRELDGYSLEGTAVKVKVNA